MPSEPTFSMYFQIEAKFVHLSKSMRVGLRPDQLCLKGPNQQDPDYDRRKGGQNRQHEGGDKLGQKAVGRSQNVHGSVNTDRMTKLVPMQVSRNCRLRSTGFEGLAIVPEHR